MTRSAAASSVGVLDIGRPATVTLGFAERERFANSQVRHLRDDLWSDALHPWAMHDDAEPTSFLMQWREYRGLSQERLAELVGTSKGHISDMERGKRGIPRAMALRLARGLEITPEELSTFNPLTQERRAPRVKLVGYVAAEGDEVRYYADGDELEHVEAPRDATTSTVAMQIRGDSLGRWYNGWLVFFDDQRDPPTEDMFGQLCVVGLADGRVVLKVLRHMRGGFLLESQSGATITDASVAWAAKVKGMSRR